MKKIIIPILLITLFGCKSSIECDKFKTIITEDLIKQSLFSDVNESIKLKFNTDEEQIVINSNVPTTIKQDNGKNPHLEIIVKRGKSILTDDRLIQNEKEIEQYMKDASKTILFKDSSWKDPKEKRRLMEEIRLSFTPQIGFRAIKPPSPKESDIIIFTTNDGKYDIKIISFPAEKGILTMFAGCNLNVSKFSKLISEKYNKKILNKEKF